MLFTKGKHQNLLEGFGKHTEKNLTQKKEIVILNDT